MKTYHAQESPSVNGREKERFCSGEEKVLSQGSPSAEIDEMEDKRADEINKETESHRPHRRRAFVGLRVRIEDLHDLMTLLMSWLNRFYLFFSGVAS